MVSNASAKHNHEISEAKEITLFVGFGFFIDHSFVLWVRWASSILTLRPLIIASFRKTILC